MTALSLLRRTRNLVLLVGVSAVAHPALAEDYPFSGLYWPASEVVDSADLDKLCALTFLDQKPDGSWSVFHVDLDAFKASRTITYRKISEGKCTFDPGTKVETCSVAMDKSFPDGEGTVVYDVIAALTEDRVETLVIDDASGAEAALQAAKAGTAEGALNYLRCPFPEAALTQRISADPTTATAEALNALRFPTDELVASPEVALLVEALRGQ